MFERLPSTDHVQQGDRLVNGNVFAPDPPMDGMQRVAVWAFICERCLQPWLPRDMRRPRTCPKCKSPYWDRPRRACRENER